MEPVEQDNYIFTDEDLKKIEKLAELTDDELREIDNEVESERRAHNPLFKKKRANETLITVDSDFDAEKYRNKLIKEKMAKKMARTRKRYWLDVVNGGNSKLDLFDLEMLSNHLDRETFLDMIKVSRKTGELADKMYVNKFRFKKASDFKVIEGVKEYHTSVDDEVIRLLKEMIERDDVPKPNKIIIEMKENQGITRLSDLSKKMDDTMSERTRKTLKGMIDWDRSKFSVTLNELDEDAPEKFYFQGGHSLVRTDDPRYLAMSRIDIEQYTRLTELREKTEMFSTVGCFQNYSNLTEIVLPTSIERLDDKTFMDCTALVSINIPYFTSYIGCHCFMGCQSLSSIDLPIYLERIGEGCFAYCVNLREISIPSRITALSNFCFMNCSSLSSVRMSSNLVKVGSFCFMGSNELVGMAIPTTITELGECAFPNQRITAFGRFGHHQGDGFNGFGGLVNNGVGNNLMNVPHIQPFGNGMQGQANQGQRRGIQRNTIDEITAGSPPNENGGFNGFGARR